MALIKINGAEIPAPSEFNISLMDLSKAERNANGLLIIERVRAGVRKIEASWKYLSRTELNQVLIAVSPVFFDVEYIDPVTSASKTGSFYAGDRKVSMIDFKDGVPRWKDVSVNLVER